MDFKRCTHGDCIENNPQPITNFHKNKSRVDGLSTSCKTCKKKYKDKRIDRYNKEYQDAYRAENREEINRKQREREALPARKILRKSRAYSISIEEVERRLFMKECDICGKECSTGKNLSIDHDHRCCDRVGGSCGKCVRGSLCAKCNRGLGYFMDSIEQLNNAILYLEYWNELVKNPEV